MERTREDWRPAPRIESKPIEIRTSRKLDFDAIRKAWAAVDVIQNEERVRAH
jgi:hypothetical protein